MSNLTRRNFFGVSAVVAGLGITACKKSDSDAGEKKESDTNSTDAVGAPEELVKAAKEEGKLIVYGSCEEEYLNAVCANFKSLYGIDVQAQRLSTGEVAAKIEEENGHPSADVWFGGTTDPYNVTSSKGLLEQYEPKNASHLISDKFKSTNKDWYGIYKGILGILYDKEELQRLKLDVPQDYKDLID
ncbi:MAG: ABC transporter substrate-binding protein, partial [Atopobium sp.]|nr:ABC transporter substrate-binding protein [Atopobium sp.]